MKWVYSVCSDHYNDDHLDTRKDAIACGKEEAIEEGFSYFTTGRVQDIDLEAAFLAETKYLLVNMQKELNDAAEFSLHELCIAEVVSISDRAAESFKEHMVEAFRKWQTVNKIKANLWDVVDQQDHSVRDGEPS